MAATKYTKSVSTDFTGLTEDLPYIDTLTHEIQNSSITIALDYISISSDNVDIWFKDSLTAGEQTTLGTVVTTHTGVRPVDSEPVAEDGKKYVTPDLFPAGYFLVYAGCGDDITNGVKWGGNRFKITRSTSGSTDFEWQFFDHILLAGGSLYRVAGKIDDHVSMLLYAPATVGASNPGAGAYDKYPIGGGINLFVPNGTVEGDWDLNLTEKLNANVQFTKAVPVPAAGGNTGWFDYNKTSNLLTFNAAHQGGYNLFDSIIPLSKHVASMPLLGDGQATTTIAAIKPALVLPHWISKATVTHGGGGNDLEIVWELLVGRKST